MLLSLGIILLCQLLGEAITQLTGWPVPGPVLGLVLCILALLIRDRFASLAPAELRDGTFEQTGRGILSHLSLLFVPAGVGVIQRLDVLAQNLVPIALALLISTVLGLITTAWVFTTVARRMR